MGKADVAVTAATGGPMAFVKKLAERVRDQRGPSRKARAPGTRWRQ
jgi:hypothetical protein